MVAQLTIFTGLDKPQAQQSAYIDLQKYKRIRNEVPTYLKFYTVFQYDRLKFRELINEWLETEEGKKRNLKSVYEKQKEILEKCYIRDENGEKMRDCDEKNIFSYRRLQYEYKYKCKDVKNNEGLYSQLYTTLQQVGLIELLSVQFQNEEIEEQKSYEINYKNNTIIIYPEEKQAELKDTWNMSIGDRVKAHIKVLRKLRERK